MRADGDLRPHLTPAVDGLRSRVLEFVQQVVVPVELEREGNLHDAPDSLRRELQAAARAAGVFGPQLPVELGGLGLDRLAQSYVLEGVGPLTVRAAFNELRGA